MSERWMVCSACRKEIPYSSTYYACSVSTCNRAATRLVFCSVPCWDSHVVVLRHRDAGAIEQQAPAAPGAGAPLLRREGTGAPRPAAPASGPSGGVSPPRPVSAPVSAQQAAAPASAQQVVAPASPQPVTPAPASAQQATPAPGAAATTTPLELQPADENEVLIVVSKLKKYIRDRSGMNTSDAVALHLSDHVRALCDAAIRRAADDGRKTVLDRDVPAVRR